MADGKLPDINDQINGLPYDEMTKDKIYEAFYAQSDDDSQALLKSLPIPGKLKNDFYQQRYRALYQPTSAPPAMQPQQPQGPGILDRAMANAPRSGANLIKNLGSGVIDMMTGGAPSMYQHAQNMAQGLLNAPKGKPALDTVLETGVSEAINPAIAAGKRAYDIVTSPGETFAEDPIGMTFDVLTTVLGAKGIAQEVKSAKAPKIPTGGPTTPPPPPPGAATAQPPPKWVSPAEESAKVFNTPASRLKEKKLSQAKTAKRAEAPVVDNIAELENKVASGTKITPEVVAELKQMLDSMGDKSAQAPATPPDIPISDTLSSIENKAAVKGNLTPEVVAELKQLLDDLGGPSPHNPEQAVSTIIESPATLDTTPAVNQVSQSVNAKKQTKAPTPKKQGNPIQAPKGPSTPEVPGNVSPKAVEPIKPTVAPTMAPVTPEPIKPSVVVEDVAPKVETVQAPIPDKLAPVTKAPPAAKKAAPQPQPQAKPATAGTGWQETPADKNGKAHYRDSRGNSGSISLNEGERLFSKNINGEVQRYTVSESGGKVHIKDMDDDIVKSYPKGTTAEDALEQAFPSQAAATAAPTTASPPTTMQSVLERGMAGEKVSRGEILKAKAESRKAAKATTPEVEPAQPDYAIRSGLGKDGPSAKIDRKVIDKDKGSLTVKRPKYNKETGNTTYSDEVYRMEKSGEVFHLIDPSGKRIASYNAKSIGEAMDRALQDKK